MNIGEANRMSKFACLLMFGLAVPFMLLHVGCASTAYRAPAYVSSGVDDVEYLSAYGEWLEVAPYGLVWRPYIASDWEPFYYGSWIWTNDGWAWESDEPYGWLVYHYGYWGNEPLIGWFWVPGNTWSPARVQWYTYGDYTAWAPLPPPGLVWGAPWDPYVVNVWIVVHIDVFTHDNIGHYRIAEPPRREIILKRTVTKAPPNKKQVERSLRMNEPARRVDTRSVRGDRQVVSDRKRALSDQREAVSDKKRAVSDQRRKVSDQSRTISDQARYAQAGDTARKRTAPQKSEKREVERHKTTDVRDGVNRQKNESTRKKESSKGNGETARKRK
jgi:hypothetical protein